MMSGQIFSTGALASAGLLMLLTAGCGHQMRYLPYPGGSSTPVAPAVTGTATPAQVATELLAEKTSGDGAALLKRAQADGRAAADRVLFELGLALLVTPEADSGTAREVFALLLADFPHSDRKDSAAAILGLLKQADALGEQNASLQQKLNQILDIDLEAERQRQATTP